tara:strand:- start:2187 stop:3062 length:876 start_codon:yes stop_codon:yes gene_type:complete
MSRARELAKVGGKNQQVLAGLSSHVGVSTFLNNVHMFANLDVGGNVTVTGTTTFNGGTLTLGDANTDNIVFGGEIDSHIIPDDDGTYDLGSSTKEWKDLFIDGTAHIDTLDVDGNAGVIGDLTVTGTTTLSTKLASSNLANSGVSAGTYGSSTAIPILVVNAQGQVTSASTTAVDSTTIEQLNTSVACTDTGTNGLVTITVDGSTVAVFDQALLTVTGNILPDANGTRDLGASGTRWQNIYTSDVDLNNQAKGGNTIDGSWGSYLIEEGENDLFLKNRRSGKTYKFMLQEV